MGIELEVNQRFVERRGTAWSGLKAVLIESLTLALADTPDR